MIRLLNNKDYSNFLEFCLNQGSKPDFFVTKNNQRFLLNHTDIASKVFNDCTKHGDKCFISEENGIINGVILITGYSDKTDRKYLKVCANSFKIIKGLFKFLTWNHTSKLYIKAKRNNSLIKFLERRVEGKIYYKYFFNFAGIRNDEIMLAYELDPKFNAFKVYKKEDDE